MSGKDNILLNTIIKNLFHWIDKNRHCWDLERRSNTAYALQILPSAQFLSADVKDGIFGT